MQQLGVATKQGIESQVLYSNDHCHYSFCAFQHKTRLIS